jgi:hypothetical protein
MFGPRRRRVEVPKLVNEVGPHPAPALCISPTDVDTAICISAIHLTSCYITLQIVANATIRFEPVSLPTSVGTGIAELTSQPGRAV